MSFEAEVVKDGRGRVHKLDVSFDSFATISRRYSDVAGIDDANEYDPRIVQMSPLRRGLGVDHIFQVGSIDIQLGNEDGGVDWMFDTSVVTQLYQMRARFYVGLYDTSLPGDQIPANIAWKQLGEFVFAEFPSRDDSTVRLSLADDGLGLLRHPCELPSIKDWNTQDTSPATNPMRGGWGFTPFTPMDTQIPLAFGEDEVPCLELGILPKPTPGTTFEKIRGYVVCCTTDPAPVSANDVQEVWAEIETNFYDTKHVMQTANLGFIRLQQTFSFDNTNYTLWNVYKSEPITKGGKTFRILWVGIDKEAFYWYWTWLQSNLTLDDQTGTIWSSKYGSQSGDSLGDLNPVLSAIKTLYVKGYPLSARTLSSTHQPGVNVAYDLVAYYSRADPSMVDPVTFARVQDTMAFLPAAGMVGAKGQEEKTLRDHLIDIAQSFDFDLAMGWDGKLRFAAPWLDQTALTENARSIDETRLADVKEMFPAREQRGAPFNQVLLDNLRTSALRRITEPSPGPFDDPGGTIGAWGITIQRHINSAWRPAEWGLISPWEFRGLDAKLRPVLSFKTDLEGLLYDLGDPVRITWTRNKGNPYVDTRFQVESLSYDPETGEVEMSAIWRGDIDQIRPFILDDETITRRVASTSGRTVTVQDGLDRITFSSGDLNADGVQPGDHLILMDANEALDSFKRFKALRITEVNAADAIVEDPLDGLDFGAPSAVVVANWEIRRSHLTYETTISDPANYPTSANIYGRIADVAVGGVYSGPGTGGFTDAHQLFEG